MSETSLHSALVKWYARPGDKIEAWVDGYLIDVQRSDELVEIQTRSFNKIRPKLERLLEDYTVRLVHPIAAEKWINREASNDTTSVVKRKSPKHGRVEDIFHELVFLPDFVQKQNFILEVLIIGEEQNWRHDGNGSWRRRGWSIANRTLVEIYKQYNFNSPQDFRALLPESLSDPFTARQVSEGSKLPRRTAQKMVYCLRKMGAIRSVAVPGREKWYSINLI